MQLEIEPTQQQLFEAAADLKTVEHPEAQVVLLSRRACAVGLREMSGELPHVERRLALKTAREADAEADMLARSEHIPPAKTHSVGEGWYFRRFARLYALAGDGGAAFRMVRRAIVIERLERAQMVLAWPCSTASELAKAAPLAAEMEVLFVELEGQLTASGHGGLLAHTEANYWARVAMSLMSETLRNYKSSQIKVLH